MTTEASGAIASDQPSYDVFISYRHADHSSSVHALAKELMSYGLKVFLDVETIKPFSLITTTIERSIRHSQTFIAWYSDIYMHSTACTLEFVRALAYYGLDAPERILIVNPHASLDHIYPISARAALCYSIDQMSTQSIKRLAESIYNHVSSLPSISAAPRATAPHTYGQYPNCASEHLIGFRHKELFTILDAFHASESIDATRKVSSLPVIISGPEGIGKSHCIQSYVTLFCNRYTGGIFYFDAGKNSSFDEALTTLGGQMLDLADEAGWFPKGVMSYISLTNDPRQKLAELRTFCTSKLKGQGSYLWIVENLPERMTKQPNLWRAPTSNGRTLATTVVTPSFPECRQIGLRSLMTAEVESILASECEPGFSVDRLHRLAETTAGYPGQLRILQAKIRTFGVERTCALYEELGVDGTGIEMAYGPLLQSCSDQERTLLSALTAMGPTSIPFAAVEAVLRRLDGGALEREGSADPTSTMERLSALALVTLSSKKGLTVEDPVRRLGHNDYCGLSVAPARRLAMVGLFHTLPSNVRVRLTPNLATLITHARHLLTTVDCDEAAFLIQRIGAFDALIGDHDSEQCCFRSSYEWFKAQHGEAHVDTLEALYELSLCYQNRTLEAEEAQIVEEALTKALTTVGEHSITTIKLLQRKAIMLGDKRHLDAALEHINQAESNALKLLGYNDRMTLMIQNSKALCLKAKGRIGEAIHILESAYEVCRRSFGPDDPDYRRVASNLAAMIAPDDAERAWSISKSILESSERTYGPRHHLTTWAAYDLICQAERLGRWLEQRRIAVKYFAWLFRDQTRHQRNNAHMGLADELESQTRLQRNDTHTRFAHELEKGHSSIVGRYIEMRWHLFGMSAGRMPVEWYEAAITMEYMIRGSETLDTIEFQVLLSDYILRWRKQNSRRCSAICTRMIQRWKKDHTYMNPFHAKYNAKGVREIRALLKNIVRYERGVMPRWEQMSSMLRKNQDPSLAWRPREK